MTHYISGPRPGMPEFDFQFFVRASVALRAARYLIVVPIDVSSAETSNLRRDLGILLECEAIILLPGWQRSREARLEHLISKKLDMKIYTYHVGKRDILLRSAGNKSIVIGKAA